MSLPAAVNAAEPVDTCLRSRPQHNATPLIHAAQKSSSKAAQALLEAGANPLHRASGYDKANTFAAMDVRQWAEHKGSDDVVAVL
eukprot:COSAG05_NODE_4809_length_1363_cov_5.608071_1_plen_84_part_10